MTDESVCRGLHDATRKLRDDWLSTRAATRGRRLSVRMAEVRSATSDVGAKSVSQSDEGDRFPRDVILSVDEDDVGLLQWVPYVHFGV